MEPTTPPQQLGAVITTEGVAGNRRPALLRWFLLLLLILCLFAAYTLSLGPVMRYYRDHSPPRRPGVIGVFLGKRLSGSSPDGMIILPAWTKWVYYPILSA